MPDIIFDTSVLSNFALAGAMEMIRRIYSGRGFITDHVRLEILRGIRSRHGDLVSILEAVTAGWLRDTSVRSVGEKAVFERLTVSLGLGDASCIAVAQSRSLVFACDDLLARREAEKSEVVLTGTLGILKKAVRMKTASLIEADRLLEKMTRAGFYSPVKSLREIG